MSEEYGEREGASGRYEKPAAVRLGRPAQGAGDCADGSGDSEDCCTGFSALISCTTGTGAVSPGEPVPPA